MLNEEELVEVWARYIAERDVEDLDLLVRQYAPLAAFFARRALAKAPAYQDADDILSYAQVGLISAIRRFDPNAGAKFETYATRRIPGAIIDGQRGQDPLSRTVRKRVKLMQSAIDVLWERMDRDPTLNEIAEQLGESPESVRETLLAQRSLVGSLDAEMEREDRVDTRGVAGDAEVSAQLSEMRQQIARRLSTLSGRGMAFVLVFYVEDMNVKQAATALGIKPDWCRQTREQVLEWIRSIDGENRKK